MRSITYAKDSQTLVSPLALDMKEIIIINDQKMSYKTREDIELHQLINYNYMHFARNWKLS